MSLFSYFTNKQRALIAFVLTFASLCCYLNALETVAMATATSMLGGLGAGFFISIILGGKASRQTS